MDQLTWMLRTCRTCNLMVGFSKYEFYNKLLGDATLPKSYTWCKSYKVIHFLLCRFLKDLTVKKISLNAIIFHLIT